MIDSNDIRVREFRQFRKAVRGSKDHLIVGIDIAKERHHAFFGTPTGETLFKRLVFDFRRRQIEAIVDWLQVCREEAVDWG